MAMGTDGGMTSVGAKTAERSDGVAEVAGLGADLRALRRSRGVSLSALADGVGRSVGFLSQVERGLSTPSIDDLRNLAAFFGVPLSLFFGAAPVDPREAGRIVRADARRRLGDAEQGLVEELLSPDLGGSFEVVRSVFSAGAALDGVRRRDTEETGYVVSGRFQIEIDGDWFDLKPGDSFHFAGAAYRWRNPGDAPAVVLWVISPPIY